MDLGPYHLEDILARGGMAEIWRARLREPVEGVPEGALAVKRLFPSLVSDPDFVEMFRDEAALVLMFDHENVVRTYALFDESPAGQPHEIALVMELIDGPSIGRSQKALASVDEPLTVRESLTVGVQLARALAYVHDLRLDDGRPLAIVHRDISPQNVLLARRPGGKSCVKLIDFGVARAAQRLTHTKTGVLKGKVQYMAPEQVLGDGVDHRADQFATGVLLWELLTGRQLFGARSDVRVLEQVTQVDALPPSLIDEAIPKSVDAVILRALSFRKEERFAKSADFAWALEQCLQEVGGPVDIDALIDRSEEAIDRSDVGTEGVARTRVIHTDPARDVDGGDDFDPGERSKPALMSSGWPVVVGGGLAISALVAGLLASMTPTGSTVIAPVGPLSHVDAGPSAEGLEARLQQARPHPCRTELLDELFDRPSLSQQALGDIAVDAERCIELGAQAETRRVELLKKKKLDPPPWPKKKKRTVSVKKARANELSARGALALDVGETERARRLLEESLRLDPTRTQDHRLLAEAWRRLGDAPRAAVELRIYLKAAPASKERERLVRYLARNDLAL